MTAPLPSPLSQFEGPITRSVAISAASPLPAAAGAYLWFFRRWPMCIPVDDCLQFHDARLLYVGISPDQRSKPQSRQNLRTRIRYHLKGNAEGSTLRRTLGVLLAEESGYPLRRVGSGRRITLTHLGEQWLDEWLDENALVFWRPQPEPWVLERQLLQAVSCPLNIQDNRHHPFNAVLREARSAALVTARIEPIAQEGNHKRSASKPLGGG